jgi:prepilin-type N-terminal cleavage/methylation domain-containing protein
MVPKYTILKVIIQSFSKLDKSNKGFTLIELIVSMSIILIVGGLAMNALVQSSISFSKDKKNIDSSQSLSAVLEVIGSDIRQSGENINDPNFPVIEFIANTETGSMPNSSKIIVRRALTTRLTLCDPGFTPTATSIIVADNKPSTVTASSNCDVGTAASPLSVYRVATTVTAPAPPTTTPPTVTTISSYYPPSTALNPYPTSPAPLDLKLPLALRKVRDYRCNKDPNTNYDSAANAGADFCSLLPIDDKGLRIAVSSSDGQLLIFNQTDEVADVISDTTVNPDPIAFPTSSTKRYKITVNRTFDSGNATAVPPVPPDTAIANNTKNSASTINYNIGDPIYVIDERVYTLTNDGSFKVSVNGAPPEILIKKIANFRVSARTYTNSTDRIVQATPAADVCTDALPFAAQPTTGSADSPKYICKFNYFTTVTAADKANWKILAGIKVELQTKYDGTGKDAEHRDADNRNDPTLDSAQVKEDKKKLVAVAEFFPRNVLSK